MTVAPPVACLVGRESDTAFYTGDSALDAVQALFQPVLEANCKELVGRTGRLQGFGAGTNYPQIWLRDGATLIPATRYHYPRPFLDRWLEEHLSHQGPDGQMWDWVAAGGPANFLADAPRARSVYAATDVELSADKNTTAADQESSAVNAAWAVYSLTGDRAWLTRPIAGEPLVGRLDAALSYVRRERFHEEYGLVTSALTADWGDVSPAHADQRAIYLDEQTPVVVGLYANALFARAADELAMLLQAAGERRRAGQWRRVAESIREAIDRHLWQEDRGFYRVSRVVVARGAPGPFDDSDIFALGGNALAVLHDVADARQAARIFAAAEARSRQAGLSSIAGVLLPPYPGGFFRHPILRDAFTYQNGGQWDWWSGRFLLAMFRRGHSAAAHAQLLAVARRIARAGGVYEWHGRDDVGRGSERFAGSVGALAAAIYEGLFGLESRADGLDITVRLGAASGGVRVREPALGRRVAYDYRYEPAHRRVRLHVEGNAPGIGRLAVRLPDGETVQSVLLDGRPVRFAVLGLGAERHVSVTTDWTSHDLELQMH
jgi:hypothetical protein